MFLSFAAAPYSCCWKFILNCCFFYPKTFTGNQNNVDEVRVALKSEVFASIVRIIPQQHSGGKAMRIEIKACPPGCHNKWLVTGSHHQIEDSALTASSSYDSFHGPARSRLFTEAKDGYTGAWSAGTNNKEQWIQVCYLRQGGIKIATVYLSICPSFLPSFCLFVSRITLILLVWLFWKNSTVRGSV